ncbi:hypothetical protein AVEN_127112-1 [Araneus ventricosus]|uniref:Uncharacterized protein n=1 Tax=Araneus ventricosus TaxID=182803 RepID=A0A4Y2GUG6_ARAVE|nr:hypothetical protein AVEN_127112-1 [Araneus ventricosus]
MYKTFSHSGPPGSHLLRLFDNPAMRKVQVQNPNPLTNSGVNPTGSNVFPLVWCGSLKRRMPTHVSSSSSDHSSKLRSRSQNCPCVASKRDVNITKLNYTGG